MKKILLIFIVLLLFSGCNFIGIERSTYTDRVPRMPQKGTLSVASQEVLAKSATEINKGLGDVKNLSEYASIIPKEKLIEMFSGMKDRLKILHDFSYVVMDFFGAVAGDEIDWSNPDKYFAQVEQTKEELKKAQTEKRKIERKYEKDMKKFRQDLMDMQNQLNKKQGELKEKQTLIGRIWGWIWKTALLTGLILIVIFIIEHVTHIPIMSIIFGGAKAVTKGMRNTVGAIEKWKEDLKKEKESVSEEEKKVLDKAEKMLLDKFRDMHDEDIEKLVNREKKRLNGKAK